MAFQSLCVRASDRLHQEIHIFSFLNRVPPFCPWFSHNSCKSVTLENSQLFLSRRWHRTTGGVSRSDKACSRCEMKWLAILISCRLWPRHSLHDGKFVLRGSIGSKTTAAHKPPLNQAFLCLGAARVDRPCWVEETIGICWAHYSSSQSAFHLFATYINYCWTRRLWSLLWSIMAKQTILRYLIG